MSRRACKQPQNAHSNKDACTSAVTEGNELLTAKATSTLKQPNWEGQAGVVRAVARLLALDAFDLSQRHDVRAHAAEDALLQARKWEPDSLTANCIMCMSVSPAHCHSMSRHVTKPAASRSPVPQMSYADAALQDHGQNPWHTNERHERKALKQTTAKTEPAPGTWRALPQGPRTPCACRRSPPWQRNAPPFPAPSSPGGDIWVRYQLWSSF